VFLPNYDRLKDMNETIALVVVAQTIILACSGLITFLTYRAYRRTGSPGLRALTMGMGFVALGALLGGGLYQVGRASFDASISIETIFTALGLLVVTYSIYSNRAADRFL
jgi:hypothetical protein